MMVPFLSCLSVTFLFITSQVPDGACGFWLLALYIKEHEVLKQRFFPITLPSDIVFLNLNLGIAAGTPYENGMFRMKLILSRDFPQSPPKGRHLVRLP